MKLSLYWRCQLAGWTVFIVFQLIIALMVGRFVWYLTQYLLAASLAGLMMTHGMRRFIHSYQLKTWPLRKLIVLAMVTVPIITAVMTTFSVLLSQMMQLGRDVPKVDLFPMVVQVSINWALVFLIWLTIYFGVSFFKRYQQTEIEKWKMKALLKETELQALRAQINPHFMFNCLTSACALTVEDPPKAQKVLTRLSDLLRHALASSEQPIVLLEQELAMTRKYLELEAIRLEDRLSFSMDVGPESQKAKIPAMMLQMLVENSIKHGIATRPLGGCLEIRSDLSMDQLHIHVGNTGSLNDSAATGHGLGVRNVIERLKLLYGNRAHFSLRQAEPEWVIAELTIPLEASA